jgi:hypothetical protein
MAEFARITGKRDLGDLDITDLVSLKEDLSRITGCGWIEGPGSKG